MRGHMSRKCQSSKKNFVYIALTTIGREGGKWNALRSSLMSRAFVLEFFSFESTPVELITCILPVVRTGGARRDFASSRLREVRENDGRTVIWRSRET